MNKHNAIIATYSNVVTIRGDVAYDKDENIVQYNETAVQAYMNANAYKAKRATAYPSIVDQLDLMYHGGYDAWKAAIQSVKEEFPK
jgi:rhodanese-related sulfurtransferase